LLERARSDEEEREGRDASDSGSSASEGGDDEAQGMDDGTASHVSGDASAGSDVSRSSSDEKGDDDGDIDDASVGSMGEYNCVLCLVFLGVFSVRPLPHSQLPMPRPKPATAVTAPHAK